MSDKLNNILETWQGNVYPAMLDDLGLHLGVSSASLCRLSLGWAPIVAFKKGKNFQGWWVIPERDADGEVVGLGLRSQDDMKLMLPGSKHGLIYEVNPQHEKGNHGYEPGPGNWVRTMDAGRDCPICGKPDGCLLSRDDPADPKAVVCIRISAGSAKSLRFGHLHIRRPEGILAGISPLSAGPGPVLIVEGMTDVATAFDLGFCAVGRPSNLACLDMLADLVRSRDAIIVGENDRKSDGRHPGREGMLAAFQAIRNTGRNVSMLLPPEHIKDLRQWFTKFGLTREGLLQYHADHKETIVSSEIVSDVRPMAIARQYLADTHHLLGRHTLRRWANAWWVYRDGKYREVKDEEFRRPIYLWSHDKLIQTINKDGDVSQKPLIANISLVNNLADAIGAETLIDSPTIPCWINDATGPDPRDLIAFQNGIVHVPSFLDGLPESEYLLAPTPDLFTTAVLPFAFDPTASCPIWLGFLRSSLGGEPIKTSLLREWFGYCMTPDTSMQKMMYLRGPKASGKGVILNILAAMMGEGQSCATSFADLIGPFGIQAMIGKLVCLIGDARTPRNGDTMRGLELLLNITSGDGVQINRKFKDPIDRLRLFARFTIASNEFLEVPDHAGALARRMNIIEFTESFFGREDFGLEKRILPEIPGIALWALQGLRMLRREGHFKEPESSKVAAEDWRLQSSPLASFMHDCTNIEAGLHVTQDELYGAWTHWAGLHGIKRISTSLFRERMRMQLPTSTWKGDTIQGIDLNAKGKQLFGVR